MTTTPSVWIRIRPASPGTEQQEEALKIAKDLEMGVRMEVHSSHTEFWASPGVVPGWVEVYACTSYKGMLEYITCHEGPSDEWWAEWKVLAENREKLSPLDRVAAALERERNKK